MIRGIRGLVLVGFWGALVSCDGEASQNQGRNPMYIAKDVRIDVGDTRGTIVLVGDELVPGDESGSLVLRGRVAAEIGAMGDCVIRADRVFLGEAVHKIEMAGDVRATFTLDFSGAKKGKKGFHGAL